jgi:hypothetical protein
MASNFKIEVHREGAQLHLSLTGDFDGTSAFQLLNILKKKGARASEIFVHTEHLRNVYAFGGNVFRSNLGLIKGKSVHLRFTGENAAQLAPHGIALH